MTVFSEPPCDNFYEDPAELAACEMLAIEAAASLTRGRILRAVHPADHLRGLRRWPAPLSMRWAGISRPRSATALRIPCKPCRDQGSIV